MDAYTIVLLVLLVARGLCDSDGNWPNVGSVLFSRRDAELPTMEKSRVALLRARRHFQALIPPPEYLAAEDDYVQSMLAYFRDAYACIKKESPDPEVDKIMTTALSDVVGGYIKLYMLPFTKVFFYGGVVSADDAGRVYNFFNEVKKYLNTNGTGWREPDQAVLKSIAVAAPRLPRQYTTVQKCKNIKDPCNNFAYLEKTKDGLEIPMPSINWDEETMFVPFKKESTFSLTSPKYSNSLNKYFDHAKCCVHTMNPEIEQKFNDNFQKWLSEEVLPHLYVNNDHLYVALGNVLTLVNKTKIACDNIINFCNKSGAVMTLSKCKKKKIPIHKRLFKSKTVIFLAVVLLIEVIWCICAFKHIFWKKGNKNSREIQTHSSRSHRGDHCRGDPNSLRGIKIEKRGSPKVLMASAHTRTSDTLLSVCKGPCSADCARKVKSQYTDVTTDSMKYKRVPCSIPGTPGVKLQQKPRSHGEFACQYECPPQKQTGRNIFGIGNKNYCENTASVNIIYESATRAKSTTDGHTSLNSSCDCKPENSEECTPERKVSTESLLQKETEYVNTVIDNEVSKTDHAGKHPLELVDVPTVAEKDPYAYWKSQCRAQKSAYNIELKPESSTYNIMDSEVPATPVVIAAPNTNTNEISRVQMKRVEVCPCVNCLQNQDETSNECRCEISQTTVDSKVKEESKTQIFLSKELDPSKTIQITKTFTKQKDAHSSRRSRNPTYVEIQIEKPKNAEIRFGITGVKGKVEATRKVIPSKIPKKAGKEAEERSPEKMPIELPRTENTTLELKETTLIDTITTYAPANIDTTAPSRVPEQRSTVNVTKFNLKPSYVKVAAPQDVDERQDEGSEPKPKHGILKYYKKRAKIKESVDQVVKSHRVFVMKSVDTAPNVRKTRRDDVTENKSPVSSPSLKRKSFIPKMRKPGADDDTVIKSKKNTTEKERRLNVTL